MLEIYAEFDSLKHCQVAFARLFNKLTNYTGKSRKKKKRKSPKRIFTLTFRGKLRHFKDIKLGFFKKLFFKFFKPNGAKRQFIVFAKNFND